jgi:hypothetical protein
MKSLMSIPTLLTVIVVAIVIALIPLSPLPLSASSDSDESETNAEQRLRQKNLGSGESDNFNCAENMITSASEGIDCIPSGPAPPTPPPPEPVSFTIVGTLSGTLTNCAGRETIPGDMSIDSTGEVGGTVTGTLRFVLDDGTTVVQIGINGGTTDGNTFSLSGPNAACFGTGAFTVSGDCGPGVTVTYEEPFGSGTFTGDVTCTLL